MLILGIETSCDETAASLVQIKNGKIEVLSNVISSQVKLHAKYGGVVPSLAAREHVKNLRPVLKLTTKGISLKKIDLIAVTAGPGLISSLLVGTAFAKTLAWKLKKPIIGINHTEGHIVSNWLAPVGESSKFKIQNSKLFPAMCLVVSGGHTQLILMKDFGKRKIVGETLDDAAGEAFDKIARILGLGYPGGPIISAIAEIAATRDPSSTSKLDYGAGKQQATSLQIKLPRPMINSKNSDFSFAGLKTAVLYLDRDLKKQLNKKKLPKELISQIAAEAQQAIIDVLVSKTIRAAKKYGVKSIMLSGGVSANKLLRLELEKKSQEERIKFFCPPMEYTTDNAAMIALAGYFKYRKNKKTDWRSVRVNANRRI